MSVDDGGTVPIDHRDIVDLMGRVQALKELKRRGWVTRGVPAPESVADHSYGVAILTLVFARHLNLDSGRAVTMALLHDIGESIIGDVIPADKVDAAEKATIEEQAIREVLGPFDSSGELIKLWLDFHYQRSPEGVLVHELDKLEMAFQAYRYENVTQLRLDEFFAFTEEKLQSPELLSLLRRLLGDRSAETYPP